MHPPPLTSQIWILSRVSITSHNKPDGFFLFSLKEVTSETNLKALLIRPQDSVPHRLCPFQEPGPTQVDSISWPNLLEFFSSSCPFLLHTVFF